MQFQFSLRWLLVMVTLAALACVLYPPIRHAVVSRQLQASGATILLNRETDVPWFDRPAPSFADHLDADVSEIVWDARQQNGSPTLIDDSAFTKICHFPRVWNISVDDSTISDQSIGEVRRLPKLSVLRIGKSRIGDEGVKALVENDAIENLILSNNRITDASSHYYQSLPKLYYLKLSGTMITDASVAALSLNNGLTYLDVRDTGITPEGASRLRQALPNCKVVH